jgi:hypothetical protein
MNISKNNCEITEKPIGVKGILKSFNFWKKLAAVIIGASIGIEYFKIYGNSADINFFNNQYSSMIIGALFAYLIANRPCRTC